MLGVRPNGDAAGAQRLHDGGVCSAVGGITVESLEIETDGEIDLRGFLGIDATVPPGYENLSYIVRIKGNGTKEEFAEIHEAVMATSPNFYNVYPGHLTYWSGDIFLLTFDNPDIAPGLVAFE